MSDSNQWAETGTLTHIAIDAFHKLGSEDAALFVLSSAREKHPLGNVDQAGKYFRQYLTKQSGWGAIVLTERKVRFTLPPHESDPTQEEIVITGTLDQVRQNDGYVTCDVKTGAPTGREMLNYHAPQLAAYQVGAAVLGFPSVNCAIIRLQDFRTGGPVIHYGGWDHKTALQILDPVRLFVAQVRAGKAFRVGGKHCDWCDFKSVANCRAGVVPPPRALELLTLGDLL